MYTKTTYYPENLISPARYKEISPRGTLLSLGIDSGDICADIGCGNGFFTLPMADIVGPSGLVYAVDIETDMLDSLKKRIRNEQSRIIIPMKSTSSAIPLSEHSITKEFLSMVLHEADHPDRLLNECLRILAKRGSLFILEWAYRETAHGPDIEKRISLENINQWLAGTTASLVSSTAITASHMLYHIEKGGKDDSSAAQNR